MLMASPQKGKFDGGILFRISDSVDGHGFSDFGRLIQATIWYQIWQTWQKGGVSAMFLVFHTHLVLALDVTDRFLYSPVG
jgi:hypothetical protein